MADGGVCLGICYADNQLFYAVNDPEHSGNLRHIGCFDFNFDVKHAIVSGQAHSFSGIETSLSNLRDKYECETVRILSPATEECWSVLTRSVYEETDEREAFISVLMNGVERRSLQSTWFPLSNSELRMLLVRNSDAMNGFNHLLGSFKDAEYVAEFEIGKQWQHHTKISGSFLTVHCQKNYISVASYLLGKLRGCTIINFENRTDLPYLWTLHGTTLSWMSGIHEQVYVYGQFAREASEVLNPIWDDTGEIILMNTLESMKVEAPERTYGFRLESAFPAVMMSLNLTEEKEGNYANHNG